MVVDPTAQTEPLTKGQQIVADYESSMIAEPCELAEAIDAALNSCSEQCPNCGFRPYPLTKRI